MSIKPDILTECFVCLHCGHAQSRGVSGFSWYIQWECNRCLRSTWRYWLADGTSFTTDAAPWRALEILKPDVLKKEQL